MSPKDLATDASSAIQSLWLEVRDSVLARVDVLDRALDSLEAGSLDIGLRRSAEREAHRLAGLVGTFGFPVGSELAAQLEHELMAGPAQESAPRLAEMARDLRRELEASPLTAEQMVVAEGDGDGEQTEGLSLLIVDGDPDLAERLSVEARIWGMNPAWAASAEEARKLLTRVVPDVIMLDLDLEGTADGAGGLLAQLTGRGRRFPVLVTTASDRFEDRLEVARLGARGYLHKSLPVSQMLDAVVQLQAGPGRRGATVLAVDDDPEMLLVLDRILETHGITTLTLSDPLRFWSLLEENSPDLVILDIDMPDLSGVDLCRTVRNDPRWAALPVLFLTRYGDPKTIREVFAAGADDYVVKPVVGLDLMTKIENRLQRAARQQALADSDALTGAVSRRRSIELLARLVRLSGRFSHPLCLAMIDLDLFKEVNDQFGKAAGDAVLRRLSHMLLRHFRGEDVVARWGGEEFLVGMYGITREVAVTRLEQLAQRFAGEEFTSPKGKPFGASFSAGVAEYSRDALDLPALLRAADQAMRRAKAEGRDRILPAG
ncbi:MAG TPA: response regulator [Actinomycetota bacterium]|nr:response regulator [Actinomycetota bacterium]